MDAVRQPMTTLATFVVERYWPGVTVDAFTDAVQRVAGSTRALRDEGVSIHVVSSQLVPADEAAYWVVDAPSAAIVEQAWALAGVPVERIVQALEVRPATDGGTTDQTSIPS